MDHSCGFIFATGLGKTALGVALCLGSLLLLLDGRDLQRTCGHGHSRRDRCEDITDHGDSCGGAVGIKGVGSGLRHCLYHLHRKHLLVGVVLDFGLGGLFLLFGFLDLVRVALGKLDFTVILFLDLCSFEFGASADILGILLHTGVHDRENRRSESCKACGPVAAVFLRGVKEIFPRLVYVEQLVGLLRAKAPHGVEALLLVITGDALLGFLRLFMGDYTLGFERGHAVEVSPLLLVHSLGRIAVGSGRLRQIFRGVLLAEVSLCLQELLVRNKVLVVCLKQQFFFEVIALLGFEIFILLLPLGHTLCEKFLTAQLLRGLGLFNLHLIVVVFLRDGLNRLPKQNTSGFRKETCHIRHF